MEYGPDLQGSLLRVAHDICAHEGEYSNGLTLSMKWSVGGLALSEAELSSVQSDFRILGVIMSIDYDSLSLGIGRDKGSVEDGDWMGEEILEAFTGYYSGHMETERQYCVAAVQQRLAASKLVRFRSATDGAILIQ